MDTIDSTIAAGTCVQVVTDSTGIKSIAIDRKRNSLYYLNNASPNQIYKYDIKNGTSNLVVASTSTSYPFNALCVDEATGYIYYNVRMNIGSGTMNSIICYNPNTELPGPVTSYPSSYFTTFDMIVKNGYLYASYHDWNNTVTPPTFPLMEIPYIVRLPLDLDTNATPPVYLPGKPRGTDPFIGPSEFIAVTNRKLYLIDEDTVYPLDDGLDRIISFDDISGSGWDTYGNADSFFWFYSHC